MGSAEAKKKELAILRSQARNLEESAEKRFYVSPEFLDEQYHRLRDNLVALDPDANKYLPDFRRKGFGGALMIDLSELREKALGAIHQLTGYLDAIVPTTSAPATKTTLEGKDGELNIPEEILNCIPPEVRRTIEGVFYNFEGKFTDFCFMGMRKALIDAIRIRFCKDKKEDMLYDQNGNAYGLSKWIELAKQERYISSPSAKDLTSQVKVFGDTASHDFMANLQLKEVPNVMTLLRLALSRMFYENRKDV